MDIRNQFFVVTVSICAYLGCNSELHYDNIYSKDAIQAQTIDPQCNEENIGFACDDGLVCTINDFCNIDGQCQGYLRECSSGMITESQCQVAYCSETNGCEIKSDNVGQACDDGNNRTTGEICQPDGMCGVSRYPGPCQQERDLSNDDMYIFVSTYTYTEEGKLSKEEISMGEIIGEVHEYFYDANGHLAEIEIDANNDKIIDLTLFYFYDPKGNLIRYQQENESRGIFQVQTYTYNPYDNVTLIEIDWENDGNKDAYVEYTYDEEQRLIQEISYDDDNIEVTTYEYDSFGNLVKEKTDIGNDGTFEWIQTSTFDLKGYITKTAVTDSNGNHKNTIIYSYYTSFKGNHTRIERDSNFDGNFDYVEVYTYDQNGNLLTHFDNNDLETNTYDCWE